MAELYKGRGNASMQDDYIDFINYVFGFNGDGQDFYKLLPKLYRRQYDPAASNYVVTEDGRLKAAVGAYDSEVSVCGTTLRRRGIGNVAVHPFARSRGYMKDCMKMAIDDMISDGVDFSDLGGRRQRYGFFGYEKAGAHCKYHINGHNIRYIFGDSEPKPLEWRAVKPDDNDALDAIAALSDAQPYHAVRDREKLHDILISWQKPVRALYENGAFRGYEIGDGEITEIVLTDPDLLVDSLRCFLKQTGRWDVTVTIAPFQIAYGDRLHDLCEDVGLSHGEMFCIFNFRRVTEAFLRLKAQSCRLVDGSLTLLIHGVAGDESFTLNVADGVVTATDAAGAPDVELDHLRAISALFGVESPDRNEKFPPALASWFPLPIWIFSADAV